MQRFRNQEIDILITTNMIARGIDVPECELVINFDVPTIKVGKNQTEPDYANYLHRIGRAGRFGRPGVAVTIWDRDIDKEMFDKIIKHY
jgi:superfamily II DNA/RNA helicase